MKKNILIIDDSALMRRVLSDIINSDDRFTVKDYAKDGLEGFDLIVKNHAEYDAVILDINMPKMDGLEVLEQLQKNHISLKVIMVSTLVKEGANETILALERGAFDFVTKPENYFEVKSEKFKDRLTTTLALATGIGGSVSVPKLNVATASPEKKTEVKPWKVESGSKLVAMACSTGGPKSLKEVLPLLPKNLDAPVLLVQHMPKGFTTSLAARLNDLSQIGVKEAEDGDVLQKGMIYLAPGGRHMSVVDKSGACQIKLSDEPARDGLRPCANVMYESLCDTSFSQIVCVVMTGMGADGTAGIGQLKKSKNIHVISQDAESCVVYGMPRALAEAGLSDEVVSLGQIADTITRSVGVRNNGR